MNLNDKEKAVGIRSELILSRLEDLFEDDERINQEMTLQALLKIGQTAYRILHEH